MNKITHKTANSIAKKVLSYVHTKDPRCNNINAVINNQLEDIGLGWILKENTYIDGLSYQFIKNLSKDIRDNAVPIEH